MPLSPHLRTFLSIIKPTTPDATDIYLAFDTEALIEKLNRDPDNAEHVHTAMLFLTAIMPHMDEESRYTFTEIHTRTIIDCLSDANFNIQLAAIDLVGLCYQMGPALNSTPYLQAKPALEKTLAFLETLADPTMIDPHYASRALRTLAAIVCVYYPGALKLQTETLEMLHHYLTLPETRVNACAVFVATIQRQDITAFMQETVIPTIVAALPTADPDAQQALLSVLSTLAERHSDSAMASIPPGVVISITEMMSNNPDNEMQLLAVRVIGNILSAREPADEERIAVEKIIISLPLVAILCSMLNSKDQAAQHASQHLLCTLADTNTQQLCENNLFLQLWNAILASTGFKQARETFQNILHKNPGFWVDKGLHRQLAANLAVDDLDMQYKTLHLLANAPQALANAFIEEGGLPGVIRLMENEVLQVQVALTCAALVKDNQEAQEQVVKDTLDYLPSMLADDDTTTSIASIRLIQSLALATEAILGAGLGMALIPLATKQGRRALESQKALHVLATANPRAMIAHGMLDSLYEMLKSQSTFFVASTVLQYMAESDPNALVEVDAVPQLLDVLKESNSAAEKAAAGAIVIILDNAVPDTPGTRRLCEDLNSPDEMQRSVAADCLWHILSPRTFTSIVETGALPALLCSPQTPEQLSCAFGALRKFIFDHSDVTVTATLTTPETLAHLLALQQRVTKPLIDIEHPISMWLELFDHSTPDQKQALVENPDFRIAILGDIERFATTAFNYSNCAAAISASAITRFLMQLSSIESARPALAQPCLLNQLFRTENRLRQDRRAVERLPFDDEVRKGRADEHQEQLHNTLFIIANLTQTEASCHAVVTNHKALAFLFRQLETAEDEGATLHAAEIIANLTSSAGDVPQALLDAGVSSVLQASLEKHRANTPILLAVTQALENLTSELTSQTKMLTEAPQLLSLLADCVMDADPLVCDQAKTALANLCVTSDEAQRQAVCTALEERYPRDSADSEAFYKMVADARDDSSDAFQAVANMLSNAQTVWSSAGSGAAAPASAAAACAPLELEC